MTTTDTLVLGDFNVHNSSWYSGTNDSGGNHLEKAVSNADLGILNWDSPTRLPCNASSSSPDVSLASASLITCSNWQTKAGLGSDHLPFLIRIQMESSTKPIPHRTSHNLKKANWELYTKEIEGELSKRCLSTDCEKLLRTIILKAASLHIPSGRHHLSRERVPADIQNLMKARDDLRSQDLTSSRLQQMNDEQTV